MHFFNFSFCFTIYIPLKADGNVGRYRWHRRTTRRRGGGGYDPQQSINRLFLSQGPEGLVGACMWHSVGGVFPCSDVRILSLFGSRGSFKTSKIKISVQYEDLNDLNFIFVVSNGLRTP